MGDKPDENLVQYIWTYLHQGYSVESIRSALKQQSYSETAINNAIDFIYANYYYGKTKNEYQKNQSHQEISRKTSTHHLPHNVAIAIIALFGVAIIGFAFVFILAGSDDGLTITNTGPLVNPEYSNQRDTTLTQNDQKEQTSSNTNKEPTQSTTSSTNNYKQSNTQTSNKQNEIPLESSFDSQQQYTKRQIDLKVDYFSSRNPNEAIKFCNQHTSEEDISFCFLDVAIAAENSQYCDGIPNDRYRDSCYFEIVMEGINNNVCDKIVTPSTKSNCEQVAAINVELESLPEQPTIEELEDINNNPGDDELNNSAQYYAVTANFY